MDNIYDAVSEEAVIALVLAGNGGYSYLQRTYGIESTHFWVLHYRQIWAAAERIYQSGGQPGLITIQSELQTQGQLDSMGGVDVLTGIVQHQPSIEEVATLVETLKDRAARRRLAGEIEAVLGEVSNPNSPISDLYWEMSRISPPPGTTQSLTTAQALNGQIYEDIFARHRAAQEGAVIPGHRLGWLSIDQLFGGRFHVGTNLLIVGLTGVGKTTFACQLLVNLAKYNNVPVLYVSLEMSAEQIGTRILSIHTNIPEHRLWSASALDDTAMQWMIQGVAELSRLPYAVATPIQEGLTGGGRVRSGTPGWITELITRMELLYGKKGYVIIDTLNSIDVGNVTGEADRMSRAAAFADTMKLTTGWGVINLAQQNIPSGLELGRMSLDKKREVLSPSLALVKGSRTPSEKAEFVIGIYSPEQIERQLGISGYTDPICPSGKTAVILLKTRFMPGHGATIAHLEFRNGRYQDPDPA